MDFKLINHGSAGYQQMVELRMDLLRRPLGLSFTPQQLAGECDDLLVGAYANDQLMGCCVLTHHDTGILQLRQMAVRTDAQSMGLGRQLLRFAENLAREKEYHFLMLHARKAAVGFYQKCGYQVTGDEFTEVGIPHYYMEKKLLQVEREGTGT